MVVHGIPDGYVQLAEGDIVSVDARRQLDGFVAVSGLHFPGRRHRSGGRAPARGLQGRARGRNPADEIGGKLTDISHAVQRVTEEAGFSVVRSLVGHGVGRDMHEDSQIPNYGEPGCGPTLAPGMTLAIEPMITAGGYEVVVRDDQWTIANDGSLSAHFEHTVAVTDEGPESSPLRRFGSVSRAPLAVPLSG